MCDDVVALELALLSPEYKPLEFLGHNISGDGIRPLPSKVDVINRFPRPTTVKQLQEFLG